MASFWKQVSCKNCEKSHVWRFFELLAIFRCSLSWWCSLFPWPLKCKAGCRFYQICNKADDFPLYLPSWNFPVSAIKVYLPAKTDAALWIKVMLSRVSSYICEVPLYFKFRVMPFLNYELLNKGSSIKHRSVQCDNDFQYSKKNMWSFRPKVDSPPDLLKSIRPMTNNTLQHGLSKMCFAGIILLPLLK